MGRKYGMLDIDEKYNGFSCEYSEQTGRLLAGIFGRYIEDGYKIGVDMDGETVDIRQYHGHFKHGGVVWLLSKDEKDVQILGLVLF